MRPTLFCASAVLTTLALVGCSPLPIMDGRLAGTRPRAAWVGPKGAEVAFRPSSAKAKQLPPSQPEVQKNQEAAQIAGKAAKSFAAPEAEIPPPKEEPKMVDPGPPPADAIVLFNGKDLSQWQSDKGGPAKWDVKDG